MSAQMSVIELNDCTFSYGKVIALDHVTFSIEQGDFLGIIGPNGGGKTTLLRLMLGLLKPDSGTVTLWGTAPVKIRKKVGYIPQETNLNKTFPVSVGDVVLTG
jgi:zinc transport system ATP-binding protein